MKKLTVCILTVGLLLTALLCVGVFTASATGGDPCISAPDCTGTYENGFCSADATHYEAPTLNNNGTDADTTDDYYEIGNAGKLFWFAELVNGGNNTANAKLTADIVITPSSSSTRYWTPIGSPNNWFSGTLDGQGHTIKEIFCDTSTSPDNVYAALFYIIGEDGVVKNLGILDSNFKGGSATGSIAGNNYGTVQNCFSQATVTGIYDSLCANHFGGLVGCNGGVIENCYFAGNLLADRGSRGGVVGTNDGTLRNCYYDATLYTGDAFGLHFSTSVEEKVAGKTTEAFASGEVAYALGEAFGQTLSTNDYPVFAVTGNKVYRYVIADGLCSGNVFGYANTETADAGTLIHVSDTASCIQRAVCATCGEEYIDPFNHASEENVNGFMLCCGEYQPAVQNGVGANGMPLYEISNAGQLYWFAELVNKNEEVENYPLTTRHLNAKLVSDITVNAGLFDANGSYTPVNGEEPRSWTAMISYQGHFDGDHKTLSGLYLVDRKGVQSPGIGLFASLGQFIYQQPTTGRIRNLGITNSYFEGIFNVGSIAGGQYLGTVIENCWSDAFVKGGENGANGGATTIGGLVGEGRGGTMMNSVFFGVITHEVTPTHANIIGAATPEYRVINSYSPYGENDWHDATDQPDYKKWYKSREAFASGEVAVLLNKAIGYHCYGQLLGTDQGPVIGGPAVYENVALNCTERGYSNSPVGSEAHIPADAWSSDGAEHWHACTVKGCDAKLDLYSHAYDNGCDTGCNVCATTRETAHVYDNACDTACNVCGEKRETAHVYDNACDTSCNVCNGARTVGAHQDSDENDVCDACGAALPKEGLSGGAGIGIGVGATAIVVVGGFSLFWFVIKKKKWSDLVAIFK